jgi:hypothetical protein
MFLINYDWFIFSFPIHRDFFLFLFRVGGKFVSDVKWRSCFVVGSFVVARGKSRHWCKVNPSERRCCREPQGRTEQYKDLESQRKIPGWRSTKKGEDKVCGLHGLQTHTKVLCRMCNLDNWHFWPRRQQTCAQACNTRFKRVGKWMRGINRRYLTFHYFSWPETWACPAWTGLIQSEVSRETFESISFSHRPTAWGNVYMWERQMYL